ncbi:pyridoxamine 5'-phosphate oxidase family protein [Leptotrichia sp. oral taxon 212]|jgi:pyridoxamine 5'-phosphate oxidase-related, FMN-binding|uniref:pyridoxamine 5'-phosphate oxidase family protein n=1 Tax=Leptotrichia sp. oral taxon 212 TaxID=712357 RepID=UPI0006A97D87|nr:pyridoxamine 5'-phosphate oxidase family protein [Leptotrichia sp. oral taxon 212]ALA95450.1 FMN-binding protein [Leptotrichia sp. oral taxon 212]
MFTDKFFEVISHEGVVSIVTWTDEGADVSNTWNSYLNIKENRILIPAAGMNKTQANIEKNPNVKLTVGSKEVMGKWAMGSGFLILGTAKFITSGEEFDSMKEKFPFLSRVLEITVSKVIQTL